MTRTTLLQGIAVAALLFAPMTGFAATPPTTLSGSDDRATSHVDRPAGQDKSNLTPGPQSATQRHSNQRMTGAQSPITEKRTTAGTR